MGPPNEQGMLDKGYDFPLYSLDRITYATQPEDDPRYAVPIAEGRLVVSIVLRRRAERVTSEQCDQALCTGLAYHGLAPAAFAEHGLTPAWADHMRRWGDRMLAQDDRRAAWRDDLDLSDRAARALLQRGRGLWNRLSLATRMAGIGGLIVSGKAPARVPSLYGALLEAAARLHEPGRAALLADYGFGAGPQAELAHLLAGLAASQDRRATLLRERQEAAGALLVMRGAILGDLGLLGRAAALVLPPSCAAPLQMQRLLAPRRRVAQPAQAPAVPISAR